MTRALCIVGLAIVISPGCTRLGFRDSRSRTGDASSNVDRGIRDRGSVSDLDPPNDQRSTDTPAPADGAADSAAPIDAARDVASLLDTPRDSAPPPEDVARDMAPSADVMAPDFTLYYDTRLDGPLTVACTLGRLRYVYPSGTMVICGSEGILDQCSSEGLCSSTGPWKPCTATEYQQRGGASIPMPIQAWIGGCVREGATPTAPSNSSCSVCSQARDQLHDLGWACSTSTVTFSDSYTNVGVMTATTCNRVGIDDPSTEAYWQASGSTKAYSSTLCCR